MAKFNIGDTVKVVNKGKSYSTYQTWADAYGLKNYKSKEFRSPDNGTTATIIVKAKHLNGGKMLVGIRTKKGDEYIIEDKGLKLISLSLKSLLTNGRREEKTAKQLQLEKLQKKAQDVADAIKKLQDEE